MNDITSLDISIFLLINHLPHTYFWDNLALGLSGIGTYGFVWLILGLWLFIREEEKDHRFFLTLVPTGLGIYWLVEFYLKPLFGRIRPDIAMGAIITGFDTADSYSFPSGHATVAFALATILAFKEPKWRVFFYILAILISLSRIYLGKHFPLDIVIGGFLGWGIGKAILFLRNMKLFRKMSG